MQFGRAFALAPNIEREMVACPANDAAAFLMWDAQYRSPRYIPSKL
jgi:hypothetical protein